MRRHGNERYKRITSKRRVSRESRNKRKRETWLKNKTQKQSSIHAFSCPKINWILFTLLVSNQAKQMWTQCVSSICDQFVNWSIDLHQFNGHKKGTNKQCLQNNSALFWAICTEIIDMFLGMKCNLVEILLSNAFR